MDYAALTFKPKDPQMRKYNQLALNDEKQAIQLDPASPDGYLEMATSNCNLANADVTKRVPVPASVEIADKMLADPNLLPNDRCYAYRVRANGMGYAPNSLAYLQKADAILPSDWRVNWSMGIYYTVNNNLQEAERHKTLSHTLQDAAAKSDTAFILSASHDEAKRDGQRAFQLASQACISTNYNCYYALAALAAAYAECGDFSHAIEYQQKALQLAPEHRRDVYTQRLASYQELKPWRIK
jgi:tetratricopeptide (TPR) repeat protein